MNIKEYFNNYIVMPDYDLTSNLSIQFYQQGGFAGFYGPKDVQFQNLALPQAQKQNTQELDIARTRTLLQALDTAHRMSMDRKNYALNVQRLGLEEKNQALREQQLELSKNQFEWTKQVQNFTMMNTVIDKISGHSFLPDFANDP